MEDKPLGIKSGLKLRGFVTPITLCRFITWVAKDADKEVSDLLQLKAENREPYQDAHAYGIQKGTLLLIDLGFVVGGLMWI